VNLDGIGSVHILPSDKSRLGRCHICQTKRPPKEKIPYFVLGDASLVAAKLAK
jgi:hypothetical protein